MFKINCVVNLNVNYFVKKKNRFFNNVLEKELIN